LHPVRALRRPEARPWTILATLFVLVLGASVAYVVGFGAYGFVVGAGEYLEAQPEVAACDNPGSRFGWAYEAVNYAFEDDARLLATTPDPSNCGDQGSPAGRDVVASDGTPIAGWYIPAESRGPGGPTLVLVHGGKSNKSGMLEYAPAFHHAYNLVLLDLRNSGRSGGHESTGGLREQDDLRAMIDWLADAKQPRWIGVMGNSNGAATALAEARDDPRVRALILDSMHATVETQLENVIETERHLPSWPAAWSVVAGVAARLGTPLSSVDPVRTIAQVGGRPVLLTHGLDDVVDRPADSLDRNVAAARAANVDLRVEVCAGAGHGMVVRVCGEQWTAWVREFLASHVDSGGGSGSGPARR
jgi:pimeloyl-ACP methyl ester carboxylesterase